MLNYKIVKNVDQNMWERELLKSEYATFYQTANYWKSDSNKYSLFIYVYDDEDNVKGQLSLLVVKSLGIYSTQFLKIFAKMISKLGNRATWINGPIIHSKIIKERNEILQTIFRALNDVTKKNNIMIMDGYSPPQDYLVNDEYINQFKKNEYKIEKFLTFVFDLSKSLDEIWNNVKRYTRTNIKRAQKRGITVKELETENQLYEFYNLEKEWARTKGISLKVSSSDLKNDWNDCKAGILKIFLAYQDSELISGIKVRYFNGIASPTKVISSYSKSTSLGGPALTWHVIQWAKNLGLKLYDLTGGAAPPPEPNKMEDYEKQWYDLLHYKRKWGGKEYIHYHFIKTEKKFAYKILRGLIKIDYFYRNYKKKNYRYDK